MLNFKFRKRVGIFLFVIVAIRARNGRRRNICGSGAMALSRCRYGSCFLLSNKFNCNKNSMFSMCFFAWLRHFCCCRCHLWLFEQVFRSAHYVPMVSQKRIRNETSRIEGGGGVMHNIYVVIKSMFNYPFKCVHINDVFSRNFFFHWFLLIFIGRLYRWVSSFVSVYLSIFLLIEAINEVVLKLWFIY